MAGVAFVTGAGRGIGRAIAERFAAEGASLVLAARTASDLERVAKDAERVGARALAMPTVVADDAAVERLVARTVDTLGHVDILVTAAGVASFGPVAEQTPRDWDAMLAVNLRAVMVCCRAVVPPMLARGRGSIINVASVAASRPIPGAAAYTATKAGLVDDYRFLVVPIALGDGKRLFAELEGPLEFHLTNSTTFPSGPRANVTGPRLDATTIGRLRSSALIA